MTEVARNDDFGNIGDLWKKEMEIGENVDELMKRLKDEVQPLYDLIQDFLRSILQKKHRLSSGKMLPAFSGGMQTGIIF
jgi:hypothetical protein